MSSLSPPPSSPPSRFALAKYRRPPPPYPTEVLKSAMPVSTPVSIDSTALSYQSVEERRNLTINQYIDEMKWMLCGNYRTTISRKDFPDIENAAAQIEKAAAASKFNIIMQYSTGLDIKNRCICCVCRGEEECFCLIHKLKQPAFCHIVANRTPLSDISDLVIGYTKKIDMLSSTISMLREENIYLRGVVDHHQRV